MSKKYSKYSKHLLPAFTMVEVMVTLILSSIAISTALLVYFNFSKIYFNTVQKFKYNNEILLLYSRLKDDFERSENIVFNNDYIEFNFLNGNKVKYHIEEDKTEREIDKDNIETFPLKTKELNFNIIEKKDQIIDVLQFDIIVEKEYTFPVYLFKQYSNQQLYRWQNVKITLGSGKMYLK